jgi:hypothetical protein
MSRTIYKLLRNTGARNRQIVAIIEIYFLIHDFHHNTNHCKIFCARFKVQKSHVEISATCFVSVPTLERYEKQYCRIIEFVSSNLTKFSAMLAA